MAHIKEITETFLRFPNAKAYVKTLQAILKTMKSKHGIFGYIDCEGNLVCPSITKDIWNKCQIPDNGIVFPTDKWGELWEQVLNEQKTFCSNDPLLVPRGHLFINRALAVPITYQGDTIGLLHIANKKSKYDKNDHLILKDIAKHIAPLLKAKIQKDQEEKALKKTGKEILLPKKQLEDLLRDQNIKLLETNKQLQREINKRKLKEIQLKQLKQEKTITNQIVETFLSVSDDKVYGKLIQIIQETTKSDLGVFGYINQNGAMVCPFMTGKILDTCRMPNKTAVLSSEQFDKLCFKERTAFYSNGPIDVPKGHIPIKNAMIIPILYKDELTGNIIVANKATNYDNKDKALLETIAKQIAPVLYARVQRDQQDIVRRQVEDTVKNLKTFYKSILDGIVDGVWVSDKSDNIYYSNKGIEIIAGIPHEQLLGCNVLKDFSESATKFFKPYYLKAKQTLQALHYEAIPVITPSGRQSYQSGWLIPRTKDGKFDGMICTVEDITERKIAKEALETEKDKAQKFFNIAGAMFVIINADQKISHINQKGCDILGYKENELIGKNWFDTCLPKRMGSQMKLVFNKLIAGEIAAFEYFDNPVLTKDGKERLISWHNNVMRDEKGEIIATLSSGEDITERRHAENILKQNEEQYRTLIENINVGIYRSTGMQENRFLQANPAIAKMFGYNSVEEFMEVPISSLYQDPTERKIFINRLHRDGWVKNFELKLQKKDKTPIWASCSAQIKIDNTGKIEWIDGVIEDITKRKQAEIQLQYEAIHDSLTGLYNRRYFMERLESAIKTSKRYGYPLSVCLCDLDKLKFINDTYGHQVGDEVISVFGKIIVEELRSEDVPGRYGGDEFCILFPNVPAPKAAVSVDRIRNRFQKWKFLEKESLAFFTTATFGIVDFCAKFENGKDLLNTVDQLLYKGKELGRNRVLTIVHR